MKVFTFFASVPSMSGKEQSTLIDIWRRAWKAQGWEPVILTPKDAKAHPRYAELHAKFAAFPTINPKEYEVACFDRWIAMAQVGGGICVDYDVLPFGFVEQTLAAILGDAMHSLPTLLTDNNPCPCAMHGTKEQYENMLDMMAAYTPRTEDNEGGRPHVSDQTVVSRTSDSFRPFVHDACLEYRSRTWKTALLVHYPHGATSGFDRAELMRKGAQGIRE